MNGTLRRWVFLGFALVFYTTGFSQRYLSDLDSSLFIKDTLRPLLKRLDNIHMSGYIQPQFQLAQTEGSKSYNGGDFSQFSKSRFLLRRARVKLDYFLMTKDKFPKALFTFQFDATERGVNTRDMFLRLYETKHNNFALTTGLFARPFGYEVNLSSGFRESPERGRMSQILMPVERDLGVMLTFERQERKSKWKWLKIDAGVFNGPGLSGTTDFDSRKDFISRIIIKPVRLNKVEISGGLSLLQGGWRQETKYIYKNGTAVNGDNIYVVDSSLSNIGKIAPRKYYGADVQLKLHHPWGETEIRGEYWYGKQSGSTTTTTNPGTLPSTPVYIRDFNGAFFYFLQNIINKKHQLLLKYDWYDPDTKIKGKDIGRPGTNLSSTGMSYSTIGIGYTYYHSDNIKLVLYYDIVKNELTQLPGYTSDIKDNIFTCRVQFRF
ncbi:MAG: porin [Bacteroidota bacterium]